MIIGIICSILCCLGIYGFFSGNLVLLYIGLVAHVVETIIGLYSGELKNATADVLPLMFSFGLMAGGINWMQSIAISFCFYDIIMFVLGLIMMFFMGSYVNKKEKDNKEE